MSIIDMYVHTKNEPWNLNSLDVTGKVNSLPHNPDFYRAWQIGLLKTLWEKKNMLVTSIFSFSHNVFYAIKDKNKNFSSV